MREGSLSEGTRARGRRVMRSLGALVLLLGLLPGAAGAAGTAERALALLEKFRPGMTYEEAVELLAPAADAHPVGGDRGLVRRAWLHGEFGVEIYFVEERAYRIDVLSYFNSELGARRAMDEVLHAGMRKYGNVPRYEPILGEYYWIDGPYRLSFIKAAPREVRLSRRAAQ